MKNIFIFLMLSILVFFIACDDEEDPRSYAEQLEYEIGKIEEYLADSNLNAIATPSGLHYLIEEEGTGSYPTLDSIVEVEYRGRYLNGKEFDSGTTEGLLTVYIKGWQEGIPFFREGSKGMLFIPSALGYGVYDYFGIKGNSTLIFDIEIVDVKD